MDACRHLLQPVQDIESYRRLFQEHGCEVLEAADTGRFAPYIDLYRNMVEMQLGYDAMRILGFNTEVMAMVADAFTFMPGLAHAGEIAQAGSSHEESRCVPPPLSLLPRPRAESGIR